MDIEEEKKYNNLIISEIEYYINGTKECPKNESCPKHTNREDTQQLINKFMNDNDVRLINYGHTGNGKFQFYLCRSINNVKYKFYIYDYVESNIIIHGLKMIK